MVLENQRWQPRRLDANRLRWNAAAGDRRRFAFNAYRVLLTRARQGLAIWVPEGSADDSTRDPKEMDAVADYLMSCGVTPLAAADAFLKS